MVEEPADGSARTLSLRGTEESHSGVFSYEISAGGLASSGRYLEVMGAWIAVYRGGRLEETSARERGRVGALFVVEEVEFGGHAPRDDAHRGFVCSEVRRVVRIADPGGLCAGGGTCHCDASVAESPKGEGRDAGGRGDALVVVANVWVDVLEEAHGAVAHTDRAFEELALTSAEGEDAG